MQLNAKDVEGMSRAGFDPLSRGQTEQCSAFGKGENAQNVSNVFVCWQPCPPSMHLCQ